MKHQLKKKDQRKYIITKKGYKRYRTIIEEENVSQLLKQETSRKVTTNRPQQ